MPASADLQDNLLAPLIRAIVAETIAQLAPHLAPSSKELVLATDFASLGFKSKRSMVDFAARRGIERLKPGGQVAFRRQQLIDAVDATARAHAAPRKRGATEDAAATFDRQHAEAVAQFGERLRARLRRRK